MSDGGKGSAPRPYSVKFKDFDNSYDTIFGKKKREQYVPPPLPEENFEGNVKDSTQGG